MGKMALLGMMAALVAGNAPGAHPGNQAVNRRRKGTDPLNGVVKVDVVSATPDIFYPWRTELEEGTGSGVVLEGHRILTCAHVAAGATHLTVTKRSTDDPFPARVEFLDNDCDLALLTVDDEDFFDDIEPIPFGESPQVRMQVVVAGYPMGGEGLSFTEGIVSRVELQPYLQSFRRLPAAQIDAAVNPGNSGGPVLDRETERLVGIAMQTRDDGEGLGYIIPLEIIRHFFADCEDGHIDGFGSPGFSIQTLESADSRRFLKMRKGQTGVRIYSTAAWMDTANGPRTGDVLLAIDGLPVSDLGKIRRGDGVARDWTEQVSTKQIGEPIVYSLLRRGKLLTVTNQVSLDHTRVRPWLAGKAPDYFIFGGLVFTTLTMDFYAQVKQTPEGTFDAPRFEGDDIVMLSEVLQDPVNMDYPGLRWPVATVDGKPVKNLRELAQRFDECTKPWIEFEVSVTSDRAQGQRLWCVLDTEKCRAALPGILRRYQVPADRSDDLRNDVNHADISPKTEEH